MGISHVVNRLGSRTRGPPNTHTGDTSPGALNALQRAPDSVPQHKEEYHAENNRSAVGSGFVLRADIGSSGSRYGQPYGNRDGQRDQRGRCLGRKHHAHNQQRYCRK